MTILGLLVDAASVLLVQPINLRQERPEVVGVPQASVTGNVVMDVEEARRSVRGIGIATPVVVGLCLTWFVLALVLIAPPGFRSARSLILVAMPLIFVMIFGLGLLYTWS